MDFGEEQTAQVEVQCIEGVDEPGISFTSARDPRAWRKPRCLRGLKPCSSNCGCGARHLYSPEWVEGKFCELCHNGVLGSSTAKHLQHLQHLQHLLWRFHFSGQGEHSDPEHDEEQVAGEQQFRAGGA